MLHRRHSRYSDGSVELISTRRANSMVTDGNGDRWLTVKEAAIKLNLSAGRIYQIKNFLTHRKIGNDKQGRVYFLDRTLIDDYLNI